MASIWLLTKKNLKLLFRSKSSALIVFFAPLMIILILGLFYSTSTSYNFKVGVSNSAMNEEVNNFVSSLQDQNYDTIVYENIEQCVKDIKTEAVHACITLPESFALEDNQQKEITFYVDPSKINLVWAIQSSLGNKFNLKSQQLSQEIAQDLLDRVSSASNELSVEGSNLQSLKDKSSAATSKTSELQKGFAGVDIRFPAESYDVAIIANIKQDLEEAQEGFALAKANVDNSSLEGSEQANILSLLDEAEDKLTNSINTFEGSDVGTINGLVTTINNELNFAKEQLSLLAKTISSASEGLTTTTSSLEEIDTSLGAVISSLDSIQANLQANKVTEAQTLSSPLITRIEPVAKEGSYLDYSFPALLVLVIMFTSLILGTTLVMMEKTSPAYQRNFFLPLKKSTFVLSTYLTNIVLIFAQIIIILGVSLFFLKYEFSSLGLIVLILFLASSVFTFLGMLIGYLFTSEETGLLASISLGSLFLFVSGVVLPIETISSLFREVVQYNPFVITEKLLREIFIFGSQAIKVDLLILIIYTIILFLAIIIMETILHKHLLQRVMYKHHKKQREKRKKKHV